MLKRIADLGLAEKLLTLQIFEGKQVYLAIDLAFYDIISTINRECEEILEVKNLNHILIHGAHQPLGLSDPQARGDRSNLLPLITNCYLQGNFDPSLLSFEAQKCHFFQIAKTCKEQAFDQAQHLRAIKTLIKLLPPLLRLNDMPEWQEVAHLGISGAIIQLGEQYAMLTNHGTIRFPKKIDVILKACRDYRIIDMVLTIDWSASIMKPRRV